MGEKVEVEISAIRAEPSMAALVFKAAIGFAVFVAAWVFLRWDFMDRIREPFTLVPEAEWHAVVNPATTDGGFVPGLFEVELPNGVSCYSAYGLFDDKLSCVLVDPMGR